MRNRPAFSLPLVMWAVLLFASACVTAPRKGTVAADTPIIPCGQRPEDSVYARSAPVYRDCSVQKPAKQIPSDIRVDFAPQSGGGSCYAAEVEFVVSETGAMEPGTARVVRTNSQPFAESVVNVLPKWRYDPAMLNGVAVRQIVNLKQSMGTGVVVVRVSPGSGPPPSSIRPPRGSTTPKC